MTPSSNGAGAARAWAPDASDQRTLPVVRSRAFNHPVVDPTTTRSSITVGDVSAPSRSVRQRTAPVFRSTAHSAPLVVPWKTVPAVIDGEVCSGPPASSRQAIVGDVSGSGPGIRPVRAASPRNVGTSDPLSAHVGTPEAVAAVTTETSERARARRTRTRCLEDRRGGKHHDPRGLVCVRRLSSHGTYDDHGTPVGWPDFSGDLTTRYGALPRACSVTGFCGLSRQIDRVRPGAATNVIAKVTMTTSRASGMPVTMTMFFAPVVSAP